MLKLVDRLAGSSLHGWSSMFDLCVTKEPCVYPYDGPVVKICPVADTGVVELLWPGEPVHVVQAQDLVAEFERLANQDLWFQAPGNGA
jgi:hypothetical protein